MDQDKRLKQIKKHFMNLKDAHNWCLKHFPSALGLEGKYEKEDERFLLESLLPSVEKEYDQLSILGVDKTFSAALFVLGALFTRDLVEQFRSSP